MQQELLRHTNIQTTMNIYIPGGFGPDACGQQQGGGGFSDAKRIRKMSWRNWTI
jgi:hypothetical protein